MNRSPLWRSSLLSSSRVPFSFDKPSHDRILNMAAMWMWPTLYPHVQDLMRKEDRKQKVHK